MYIFVINPTAGNGRAKRIFSKIKKTDLYHSIESTYFFTKYNGHAEKIAEEIAISKKHHITCVIVIGGDGTLHEVINGLSTNRLPVSFIPGGSGNDFARGCFIKGSPTKIFHQIINEESRILYWLGNYQLDDYKSRYFVNSIGFGFDAEVAKKANNSRYKKFLNILRLGTVNYVIALIYELFHFKPFSIELDIDGNKRRIEECWMVTITNHPFYGGGMKIIPNAVNKPDEFPVLIIRGISKWKVLGVFLTVFSGKHTNFKEVELLKTKGLVIRSENNIYYQVDGQTDTCFYGEIIKKSESILVNGTTIQEEQKDIYLEIVDNIR